MNERTSLGGADGLAVPPCASSPMSENERSSLNLELISAWCGPAFAIGLVIFFGIFGFNLPSPPSPALGAEAIAARINDNLGNMRVGWVVALLVMSLYMPWTAQIGTQLARLERHSHTMTNLQLIGGALTVFVMCFGMVCWATATFRPEIDPVVLRMLIDMGWLGIELQWILTTMQMVAMALVGLSDKRKTPLFPRWVCFLSIWCSLSFAPASLTMFLKTGPFAWDGVLSYYLPWAAWLIWCLVVSGYMVRDVMRRMPLAGDAAARPVLARS